MLYLLSVRPAELPNKKKELCQKSFHHKGHRVAEIIHIDHQRLKDTSVLFCVLYGEFRHPLLYTCTVYSIVISN